MSGRRLAWILTPFLIAALVLEAGRAVRRWQASRVLTAVKNVTVEANQRGRLTRRLIEHNIRLLRQAEQLYPAEVAIPIARGGQYMMLDRYQAALLAFEKALTIEPRGEIYSHIGHAKLKMGLRDEADRAYRRAIRLDHNQRRHLMGYVQPRKRPKKQGANEAEGAAGSIFTESFESGDLKGRSSSQSSRGESADE